MPKETRKDKIKRLIRQGYDDDYIRVVCNTTKKFVEEIKIELR